MGISKSDPDLCSISTLRIPNSGEEASLHLVKTGWLNVIVMGDRMDVCPTCQVVARAVQFADAFVAVNPNSYRKAYEEPNA